MSAINQCFRWIVRYKSNRELFGNEASRTRIPRQHLQHLRPFFFTVFFDAMTQHNFIARFVHGRLELEPSALARLGQSPSGEDLRNFSYIRLRVAAIHAERVKFHQFAAIVFIQPVCSLLLAGDRAARPEATPSSMACSSPNASSHAAAMRSQSGARRAGRGASAALAAIRSRSCGGAR